MLTAERDAWHDAAAAEEVGRKPLARTVADSSVVLFRLNDGTPVALENRCPHRGFPLAKGRLEGDTIVCVFHGQSYDQTGRCVRIPGKSDIPDDQRVIAWPVLERSGRVWVWLGEPDRADPALIPHGSVTST